MSVAELSAALNAELGRPKPRVQPEPLAVGVHLDVPEHVYHADPNPTPSLSVSTAKALVLECPAIAHYHHPRFGNVPIEPNNNMDRGSLVHSLLLGAGRDVEIIECSDWKKKGNQKLRDEARKAGKLPVTRALFDEASEAVAVLRPKLARLGYPLSGKSEVTLIWDELAESGQTVRCRGRADHWEGYDLLDIKVRDDVNPRKLLKGWVVDNGYDIQGVAYPRALEKLAPHLQGRVKFTLLACSPEPPYCVVPVEFFGSMRELGERKWTAAVNEWDRCVTSNEWPEFVSAPIRAEARPWHFDFEDAAA